MAEDLITQAMLKELLTGAIGALAGAWFGAKAAQKIAERVKRRDELLAELQCCNAGVVIAHAICSTYLNLKEQFIAETWVRYERQRLLVHSDRLAKKIGAVPPDEILNVGQMDLGTIGLIPVTIADLGTAMHGNTTAPARPRSLVAVLGQSIASLNELIQSRNVQVEVFKKDKAPPHTKVPVFFGLPQKDVIDETYALTMRGIHRQTDDCIFFSKLICTDLTAHGERLRSILKDHFKVEAPRVSRVHWEDVERKRLLPDDDVYSLWLTGFQRSVAKTYGRRWQRRWHPLRKRWRGARRFIAACTRRVIAIAVPWLKRIAVIALIGGALWLVFRIVRYWLLRWFG